MAAFIRLDLFPASAIVNGNVGYQPARIIVTDDSVFIYQDAPGGPAEVYSARLDDFTGRRSIGYICTTADGDTVQVNRASGCGCGSRLKGFHPFAGVPQVTNP